jgi:hypothetical protein
VVDGAQEREQHLPEALFPGAMAEAAALASHHREQRPDCAVAHLRSCVRAQALHATLCAQPRHHPFSAIACPAHLCYMTRKTTLR